MPPFCCNYDGFARIMGGSMSRTHPTTVVHVRTHLVTLAKPDQVVDNPLPSSKSRRYSSHSISTSNKDEPSGLLIKTSLAMMVSERELFTKGIAWQANHSPCSLNRTNTETHACMCSCSFSQQKTRVGYWIRSDPFIKE